MLLSKLFDLMCFLLQAIAFPSKLFLKSKIYKKKIEKKTKKWKRIQGSLFLKSLSTNYLGDAPVRRELLPVWNAQGIFSSSPLKISLNLHLHIMCIVIYSCFCKSVYLFIYLFVSLFNCPSFRLFSFCNFVTD